MASPDLVAAAGMEVVAAALVYVFLSGLIWGSGYSPASKRQLEAAASLLELREGDRVYDLGSGFGKAVLFFAGRYQASVTGVEIDPLRRLVTLWSARRQGVIARVDVIGGNLLDVELGEARKVFVFLSPLIMRRLKEKVRREMPPGAFVVSVEHRFPDWAPVKSVGDVHLYSV